MPTDAPGWTVNQRHRGILTVVLSLVAKSALAWQVYAGALAGG